MSKKTPKPIAYPLEIQITPRLPAAVEAAAGRRMPPGARVQVIPPAPKENPIPNYKPTL